VDDETGIYRSEVIEIFEALADVKTGVNRILRNIEEADGRPPPLKRTLAERTDVRYPLPPALGRDRRRRSGCGAW
jgi:hypothetical protein